MYLKMSNWSIIQRAKVGSRIVQMSVNGRAVERGRGKVYRIILTDFVASGGDGCSAWCYGVTPKDIRMMGDCFGVAKRDGSSEHYNTENTDTKDCGSIGDHILSKFLRRKISTVVIGYLCSRREITLKLQGRVATCTDDRVK